MISCSGCDYKRVTPLAISLFYKLRVFGFDFFSSTFGARYRVHKQIYHCWPSILFPRCVYYKLSYYNWGQLCLSICCIYFGELTNSSRYVDVSGGIQARFLNKFMYIVDVESPSLCCEYVLFPLVNKEATLAYGRAEYSKGGIPSRNRGGMKAESGRHHSLECLFKITFWSFSSSIWTLLSEKGEAYDYDNMRGLRYESVWTRNTFGSGNIMVSWSQKTLLSLSLLLVIITVIERKCLY